MCGVRVSIKAMSDMCGESQGNAGRGRGNGMFRYRFPPLYQQQNKALATKYC